MSVKVRLRVPTRGKKVRDVIEVADRSEADRLIANGTARPVEKKSSPKD